MTERLTMIEAGDAVPALPRVQVELRAEWGWPRAGGRSASLTRGAAARGRALPVLIVGSDAACECVLPTFIVDAAACERVLPTLIVDADAAACERVLPTLTVDTDAALEHVERAFSLPLGKYCCAAGSLAPGVEITTAVKLTAS